MFCCLGCKPEFSNIESAYRRGLAENPKREKIGMTRIEPSWICFRSIEGQDEWIIAAKKEVSTFKVVAHAADGAILWETDSYSSGRVVTMDDNIFQEEIKLYCDYASGDLRIIYLGDDGEISRWIQGAIGINAECLKVIDRVKLKWKLVVAK